MKKRYYGLDALRILAMAFVVIVHSISHGGVSQLVDRHTFNWFAVYFTQYACLAAVNCFVLLSSYFLVTARFNVRKVISFALHVLFYSLTIMLIACTTGIVHPTANVIIKSIAPISTSCYWFPTSYVGLLLLSPFLNAGIKAMTKRQMQFCVCCLLTFFSIIPGFALINSVWQIRTGHCLQWFIAIYFIGAYIRLYVYDIKGNVRIPLPKGIFFFLFYLACPLFDVFLRNIVPDAIWLVFHNKTFSYDLLHGDNSIIITLSAIALFMFFLTMDIKNRLLIKFIEKVAPLVFGVYLIHEWPFLREYLWTNIFSPKSYANSFLLFPYILYVVVAIFTVGLAMEYVRSKVFRFIEGSSLFASICAWLSSKKYIALMENDFDISKMNATQHREEKRREVNIDILKIVSMFAVVVLHFFGVSGLLSSLKPLSVNWWLGNFIEYTAFPAVNCYVIISGYFLCTSKFRIKKLVDLCIQVFIYSFVFYIIGSLVNLQLLNPRDLIKAIFPIPTNYLWFATAYFGLYSLFATNFLHSPLLAAGCNFNVRPHRGIKRVLSYMVYFSLLLCRLHTAIYRHR